MAIQRTETMRNALLAAINSQFGADCTIEIRSGALDMSGNGGTKLLEFAGDATAFGSVASAELTANEFPTANGLANGTAGHYIVRDSSNNVKEGGNATGDGLVLSDTAIALNQPVDLVSWVYTAAYPII